jgi:hypothetical protein
VTGAGPLASVVARSVAVAFALVPLAARAQTMLDQEERLIDIHTLLLDLPAVRSPGALADWQLSVGVEGVTIPSIDGTTGSKEQITASDRTPLYPRPRLALGLPAPEGFRAFVGGAYIPPFRIREVSTSFVALEAGFAWAPGALRVGLRGRATYAYSTSPVTDPATRDALESRVLGAEVSAAWSFLVPAARLELQPYAGAGVVGTHGRFRVTSDGTVLVSDFTGASLSAGIRLVYGRHWEGAAEAVAYPDRLAHTNFMLGYVF